MRRDQKLVDGFANWHVIAYQKNARHRQPRGHIMIDQKLGHGTKPFARARAISSCLVILGGIDASIVRRTSSA